MCVKEVMLLAGEAGGEGAATLQRVVGKDLSARAGWVVCGDAEDVYTGSVHDFLFRTCPRLVFGASACPFLSLGRHGGPTTGPMEKKLDEDCSGHGQKEAVDGNGGARGRGSGCLRKSRPERDQCEKDQKLKFLELKFLELVVTQCSCDH